MQTLGGDSENFYANLHDSLWPRTPVSQLRHSVDSGLNDEQSVTLSSHAPLGKVTIQRSRHLYLRLPLTSDMRVLQVVTTPPSPHGT